MKKSFVLLAALLAIAMLFVSCEPQPRAATPEDMAVVSALQTAAWAAYLKGKVEISGPETKVTYNNVEVVSEEGNKTVLNGTLVFKTLDKGSYTLNLGSGTKLNGKNHKLSIKANSESTAVVLDGYKLDGVKL